jgi:hypothetical protein
VLVPGALAGVRERENLCHALQETNPRKDRPRGGESCLPSLEKTHGPDRRDAQDTGVRTLPGQVLATLPLFLFLRGTTYLGWVQTRPETQAAREMTPMLIERACSLAAAYLGHGA